ncbi:hypothetical protein BKA64DRAFT_749341 [Cadophora sp. MPI-SDFR-AT-0126]|nr:hypothetical protein BKA64DRAFT_749341 [Leotiomycetes sp. MPI-SDFR-AT-0126]
MERTTFVCYVSLSVLALISSPCRSFFDFDSSAQRGSCSPFSPRRCLFSVPRTFFRTPERNPCLRTVMASHITFYFLYFFLCHAYGFPSENDTLSRSNCTSDCEVPPLQPISSPSPEPLSWSDFLQKYTIQLLIAVSLLGLAYGKRGFIVSFSRGARGGNAPHPDEEHGVGLVDNITTAHQTPDNEGISANQVNSHSSDVNTRQPESSSAPADPRNNTNGQRISQVDAAGPSSGIPLDQSRHGNQPHPCAHQANEEAPPSGVASGLTSGAMSTLVSSVLGG